MNSLLWGILSNFLVALLLGYYIYNSTIAGLKLGVSVFLIYFLIGHFNIVKAPRPVFIDKHVGMPANSNDLSASADPFGELD
jgi:hypothetical protein